MKRILLSAGVFASLLFAGLFVSPAQAQPPYRRIVVANSPVVVVSGATYGPYGAYSTFSPSVGYSNYVYPTYSGYVAPSYGLTVVPYGAGFSGGYQPYRQMYSQRVYYGLGF